MAKRGSKPGNPHEWMDYRRAIHQFITQEMFEADPKNASVNAEAALQAAIREGRVRFKKPASPYAHGSVNRLDVMDITRGKAWHAIEGVADTSTAAQVEAAANAAVHERMALLKSNKEPYWRRLCAWLKNFPKP